MAASKAALKADIVTALTNMANMQYDSGNPLNQFSEDLATAISNYCRSITITPQEFQVTLGSIVTVGGATTQAGPPANVALQPDTITIEKMNPSA